MGWESLGVAQGAWIQGLPHSPTAEDTRGSQAPPALGRGLELLGSPAPFCVTPLMSRLAKILLDTYTWPGEG